ncbi:LysE family transporter [Cryobacterium sp. LW097]|uniref:LysE family translocator n=1 Tax=Cryobacterium sp. LW097 TaxID=1978566 RepID=UPI00143D1CB5
MLGLITRSYPLLLDAVKVFGAAYLLWLAYGTIRNARSTTESHDETATGRPCLRGVLVSLTHPKVILCFLASWVTLRTPHLNWRCWAQSSSYLKCSCMEPSACSLASSIPASGIR